MSRKCELCGKTQVTGNRVSHSNRKTRRTWKPNIQRVLADMSGVRRRVTVCTTCLRSGALKRVSRPVRMAQPS